MTSKASEINLILTIQEERQSLRHLYTWLLKENDRYMYIELEIKVYDDNYYD
jgi:hypothetical protein